jgi:sortase A
MNALLVRDHRKAPRPSRRRRALRALSTVMLVVGALLVADAALTLLWKEPVTHVYSRVQQGRLGDQLRDLEQAPVPAGERRRLAGLRDDDARVAFAARALSRRLVTGRAVARVRIARIGLSEVVVQGTDVGSLRKGPGHYPGTPLPGRGGTVGIAGHRTTYGAPFRNIDDLRPGDRIVVELPYARFEYAVERQRIVPPTATWITRPAGYERLVLSACHPLYSAAQRIVIFARLVDATPRGAAAQ